MNVTCNKYTALRILRAVRSSQQTVIANLPKTDLIPPDPSPQKRWTNKLVDFSRFGLDPAVSPEHPLYVAVDSQSHRLRMRNSHCTIYESNRSLPDDSFLDLGGGLAISCPELLFIELAEHLSIAELLMLGHELCGSFSYDQNGPQNGNAVFGIPPVTSTERIATYIQQTRFLHGAGQAKWALGMLSDNAWAPTEAAVATVLNLPIIEFGYGLGPCTLNERVHTKSNLTWTTDKDSRVPDILIPDTPVGINYDGAVHLDLTSVVNAAIELERHPEHKATQQALDNVVRNVRAKAVDDIRRNRELAASGYIVFPVVKEDLYEEGGLDQVIAQVIETVETFGKRDLSKQKRMLRVPLARIRRQELIWSLIPSKKERKVSRELVERVFPKPSVTEIMIGF